MQILSAAKDDIYQLWSLKFIIAPWEQNIMEHDDELLQARSGRCCHSEYNKGSVSMARSFAALRMTIVYRDNIASVHCADPSRAITRACTGRFFGWDCLARDVMTWATRASACGVLRNTSVPTPLHTTPAPTDIVIILHKTYLCKNHKGPNHTPHRPYP